MVVPGDLQHGELLRLGGAVLTVGGVAGGLAIFIVACVLSRLVGRLFRRVRKRGVRDVASIYVLEKLSTYALVVVGALIGLSTAGLNLSSLTVFAGAAGIGLGLGLQGVVKEFFSGLFLIFDPMLSVGDYVELEHGVRGVIAEIGPRATRVRTNDNINVLIPNSHLIERSLTNWTLRGDTRRIHIAFAVADGADRAVVREAVLAAARASPFTLPETERRKSQVWLVGFTGSGLDFELLVWPTREAVNRPAAMHAAYTWLIADALDGAGIKLPLPQTDLRVRSLFGHEGEDAFNALRREPARSPRRRAVRRRAAVNDAADDVMAPPDAPEPLHAPR
jgi:small-conductance mechanosensitive channel